MSKKKKNKLKNKATIYKQWKQESLPSVDELAHSLKRIVLSGYYIQRNEVYNFNYTGFNIGEADFLEYPTPGERFSEKWLKNEEHYQRSLLDNVLQAAILLGMEKHRQDLENKSSLPGPSFTEMFEARNKKINTLYHLLRNAGLDLNPATDLEFTSSLPELQHI